MPAVTRPPLRAGIFAAGFGSRMGAPPRQPKGLTPIAGRPLIEWLLRDMEAASVSDVVVIVNDESTAVRDHVERSERACTVRWIVETTPSSMHSFLRVVEDLAGGGDDGPFLISTVDTIAPPGTFRAFVDAADRLPSSDVVMALTTRIEEQKPLLVDVGRVPDDPITDIGAVGRGNYASAGYYMVRASVLREAADSRRAGLGALRMFFRRLFDRGYTLRGVCMPESVDVDRPRDIEAAERLLRGALQGGSVAAGHQPQ